MADSLITSALKAFADSLEHDIQHQTETPSAWIQKHFYVHDPRQPKSGRSLGKPGPIRLTDHQIRIKPCLLRLMEN